ncbi:uncharacterized protein LOC144550666 [Carex rostrata]
MALYLLKFFPSILLLLFYNYSGTAHALLQNQRPYCSVNTSDTDTTFKNNLHNLLMSITTGAQSNGGYFNDTVGTSADQIYGLGMCYADGVLTECNSCLSTIASKITNDCPDSKDAGTWLESGPCVIRYSNENFFSVANTTSYYIYSSENYTNHELFGNARNTLFKTLIAKTNVSANMVASGQQSVNGIDKLYGMLQCTRDLNHQECYKCLGSLISDLQPPSLLAYTVGLRYFGFSCFVYYEMFPIMKTSEGVAFGTSPAPENAVPVTEPGTGKKFPKQSHTIVIVAVVGGVASLLVVITIYIWFQRRWSLSGGFKLFFKELQEVAASEFLIYDFTTIRNATNNFSDKNKLGMGGFGPVFKGKLPNGQEIAIKRLSTSSSQGATEFKTEVELLVRLRHNNLVQLLGCCISKDERMLCYEYLPNKSLDKILFGSDDIKCKELEWSRRYRIIKGTCRGLHYLHEESPLKIVHRDFKASNILLDRDMNPKIADFGLAKLFDRDQTQTVTAHLAGTFGYIAPECSMRGTFSAKSDTYSFGILVLEIVTGRKNSSFPGSMYMSGLTNHVWKNWSEGEVLELKDPTLDKECIEEVTKCIHIALLCLQTNPSNRPNMEMVTNMLNSSSIASLPPLPHPRSIWGADVSMFEDDENVVTNLSGWETVYTVVGDETEENSFLYSSFGLMGIGSGLDLMGTSMRRDSRLEAGNAVSMRPQNRVRRIQCDTGFDRYVCRADVAICKTLDNTGFFGFVTCLTSDSLITISLLCSCLALGEPNSQKMALCLLKFFPSILLLIFYNYSGTAHARLQNQRPYCSVNTSDTDTTFKNNLHSLLMSITTSAQSNSGYFNDTVGSSADQIYGLGMCYASGNLTECNSCLSTVASKLTNDCPDSKDAGTWLESGPCVIRYSNENFFGVANTSSYYIYSSENYTDRELFGNARNTLFNALIAKTNVSANMVASGQQSVNGIDKLYGMLQCTRDLNNQECYKCLSSLISDLQPPSLLAYTVGLRYFGFSCFVHYEMFPIMKTAEGTGKKFLTKSHTIVVVAVVGGVASLLVVITIYIWFQRKWSLSGGFKLFLKELQEVAASEFLIYDFTTIRNATNNFSDKNKLGMGGFGPVFKGKLPNGQEIAIKRLSTSSSQGATEFKTEVELLVRLRHNNLVQLLGCCISKDERMLCYEYLPNKSLDKILFGSNDIKCKELEWSRRYRIIKGTCRGLHYLHEESPLKIVHRDFKASNILLDRDMNPKIADFGIAKLFDRDQTQTVTAHLAGTFGYIAPECSMRGTFSAKSDTYSFGILVLEIVTGRKNSSFPGSMYMSGLTNHVWKNWCEGKVEELKDPTLDKECIEEVTKCIHIALLCLQTNPSNRPNMETVANMLNSSSIASLPPLPHPRSIWGADVSMFEDDENVVTDLSSRETISTVVGDETEDNSFLHSF